MNKIIAILFTLFLVLGIVPNIAQATANIETTLEDFDKIDIDTPKTKVLTLTNLGDEAVSLTLSFDANEDSENIDITFSETEIELDVNGTENDTAYVDVTALASEEQRITIDDETFGGKILVKEGAVTVKEVDLTTKVYSNLMDIDVNLDPDDELAPGEEVEVEIELDNAEYDFEDVEIKVWILDIDDDGDDDLDQESDKFDLDEGDDASETLTFQIPYNVDDGRYDIQVRIKGDNTENDTRFTILGVWKGGPVEVEKGFDEEVTFETFSYDNEVACGSSTEISVKAVNTGEDDLDDMYLKVEIPDLDIEKTTSTFDLDSDKYKDREQKETFNLLIPSDVDEGTYSLRVLAYNEDDEVVGTTGTKSITITCGGRTTVDEEEIDEEETPTEETVYAGEGVTGATFLPSFTFSNFFQDNGVSVIFWIIGNIVLILIAIYFLKLIFRKK